MTETVQIDIQKVATSRITAVDFNNLKFGKFYSDHMFTADFKNGKWDDFSILPYGNLSLSPSLAALHYGQTIFEGTV